MRRAGRVFGSAFAVVAGVVACSDQIGPDAKAPLRLGQGFTATLSPANEVPALVDPATGTASAVLANDTTLILTLNVAAVDSPTLAHIHIGAAGVNGGILVNIYTGPTRGALAYTGGLGSFQVNRGSRAAAAVNFDSLLTLMRTGDVYVNVHNRKYPGGVMRGQVQLQP
ncbi:MAG: CHRD domain-containing protein [Gemmatimonadales bacterium]